MSLMERTERALRHHFDVSVDVGAPPSLVAAMDYAVFSGGARVRPQLCLAVAVACGDAQPALSDAFAAALEFMHCASLVHDDLPIFDDADTRRGRAATHKVHGEPLALLAGDGLIVMAYQALLQAEPAPAQLRVQLMGLLSKAVGLPEGIVAGQAWECEPRADLSHYQRAKTGALFVAAARAGAVSGGGTADDWIWLGQHLGEAYQVADDIRDVMLEAEVLGKPADQDRLHARPSAAQDLGLTGALEYFKGLIDQAAASIPACACRDMLRQLVWREAERLVPPALHQQVRKLERAAPAASRARSTLVRQA